MDRTAYNREYRRKNRAKLNARKRELYNSRPDRKDKVRQYHLARKYGVTPNDYARMYAFQLGKCAICREQRLNRFGRLDIDHDHRTGRIRSLLCNPCNRMLGNAEDSVEKLQAAIRYLLEWSKQ